MLLALLPWHWCWPVMHSDGSGECGAGAATHQKSQNCTWPSRANKAVEECGTLTAVHTMAEHGGDAHMLLHRPVSTIDNLCNTMQERPGLIVHVELRNGAHFHALVGTRTALGNMGHLSGQWNHGVQLHTAGYCPPPPPLPPPTATKSLHPMWLLGKIPPLGQGQQF